MGWDYFKIYVIYEDYFKIEHNQIAIGNNIKNVIAV